jgi:uncharacterized membrane protein
VLKPAPTQAPLSWRTALLGVVVTVLLGIYLLAGHVATITAPSWAPYLSLAPLILMISTSVAGSFGWLCGALAGLVQVALAVYFQPLLHAELVWLYFVQHVGFNLALALMFGSSLRAGRVALITRMASIIRGGDMPPKVQVYTRQATQAWTLFFSAISLASVALFAWGSLEHWSVFANLLTTPLVGAMFAAEYAARRIRLRDVEHPSMLDNIQSIRAAWASQGHASNAPNPTDLPPRDVIQ